MAFLDELQKVLDRDRAIELTLDALIEAAGMSRALAPIMEKYA